MTKAESIQQLYIYEWFAVMAFSCFLVCLGAISHLNRETIDKSQAIEEWVPEIYVQVSGAVDNPGRFFVKEGSVLEDLMPQLQFGEDADKTFLKLDKPLRNGQKIRIPSIYITVTVEGEVINPGIFKMDRDSRFSDLVKELEFTEKADKKKLKSKRKLKDRETIIIPSV